MITIATERLSLRTPILEDAQHLLLLEKENHAHFSKYGSTTSQNMLTIEYWQECLKNWKEEHKQKKSVRFLIFYRQEPETLIGICNFSQIFFGAFYACYLGYRIDKEFEGKRLMQEALKNAIKYMFDKYNLHRIMANYIPSNHRSEKLLQRLGFEKEGYARDYLLINGKWQDHILTSLINKEWQNCLEK